MPNPNTIPWIHYQDIQVPDVNVRETFQAACLRGDFNGALQLLNTHKTQLWGKAYIAETINIVCNGVLELESRFNSGVLVYLNTLVDVWQVLIDSLRKRGNWISTMEYKQNNFVVYNEDVYLALKDVPAGTNINNTNYWLRLGLRGEVGASGLNVTLKYAWDEFANYNVNDLVVYGNNIYVCLKQNQGIVPNTDETTWALFILVEIGQIHVGTVPPLSYVEDTIWFHTTTDPVTQNGTTPVIGQFKRYRKDDTKPTENVYYWDEMYPETFFTLIRDKDYFRPPQVVVNIDITPTGWANLTWTYQNPNILENSIVHILPRMTFGSKEYGYYSQLTIEVTTGQFKLISTKQIDSTISIQIIIN